MKGPCESCGATTELVCTDCAIDFSKRVFVCARPACKTAHEREEKAQQDEARRERRD